MSISISFRSSLLVVFAFSSMSTLGCSAAAEDDAEAETAEELGTSGLFSGLPSGRYVMRATELTNDRMLGGLVLEVKGSSRRTATVEVHSPLIRNRAPVAVESDGTFEGSFGGEDDPWRTRPENNYGAPGYGQSANEYGWSYGGARPTGQSFAASGTIRYANGALEFDFNEAMTAPWPSTSARVFQGTLDTGSIVVQAAAARGGRMPTGVKHVIAPASSSTNDITLTSLVLFRTRGGRRFVADPAALKGEGCAQFDAVEVPADGSSNQVCTTLGGTMQNWSPDRGPGCEKHVASASVRGKDLTFSCRSGGEIHTVTVEMPTWFR